MADTQWFRRSNGQEFEELIGSPVHDRLMKDPEYVLIDGPEGDEVERPSTDEEASTASEPAAPEPPFEGYDDLTVEEVIPQLEDLDAEQLAAVEAYEVANENRKTLLEAVESRREELAEAPPEE